MTFPITIGAIAVFFLAATFTFASAGWTQQARIAAVLSVVLALAAAGIAVVSEIRFQDCERAQENKIYGPFDEPPTCSRSLFR